MIQKIYNFMYCNYKKIAEIHLFSLDIIFNKILDFYKFFDKMAHHLVKNIPYIVIFYLSYKFYKIINVKNILNLYELTY